MGEIEELKAAFPDIEIKELQGGANLYTSRGLITVYFRKHRYSINNKWDRYSYWEDFIPIVDKHINPPQKVTKIVSESPVVPNGVQDCINHIKRKAEYGKQHNLNASNIAMLNSLAEELMQYL